MTPLLRHLILTLRLNFRSRQPIIYGYVVPIFFLFAFGSLFGSGKPPLLAEMGQLLTVTVLGGACFGMPTAMVAERERGVWRRYRLLPTAIGGIITSAMAARLLLVASAAVMQIVLARAVYGTPWPEHPIGLAVAFGFVTFAFLGLGLIIAMLADTVPAVQALGQAIFLPMIMIGGVGVPLTILPHWAQHVAAFLPGRYAVETMQPCVKGAGLSAGHFGLLALTVIGAAACLAGAKLFRWDVGQRVAASAKAWVAVALVAWAGVGLAAEATGRLRNESPPVAVATATPGHPPSTAASTQDIATTSSTEVFPTTSFASTTGPSFGYPGYQPWSSVTDAQVQSIAYDDIPGDNGTDAPLAANLTKLDADLELRLDGVLDKLPDWPLAQTDDLAERVRAQLSLCGVIDLRQDPLEPYLPYCVFRQLRSDIPREQLTRAVAWVILHPGQGQVVLNARDFDIEGDDLPEDQVRQRVTWYGKKLLLRLLGKVRNAE